MDIHKNIPIKNFTSMKLGGNAKFMVEVRTIDEIMQICNEAKSKKLKMFVIGGGCNVIGRDEGYDGIIVRVRIPGFTVIADDTHSTTIQIGAGEDWDDVVKRSVELGLSGIEAMSAIPGTAGSTPIQNVGAYGQEIADTLQSLTAYDTKTDKLVTINAETCEFTYRNSIFRKSAFGRYIITSITLKLSKLPPQPPFYNSLQKYLDDFGVKTYTSQIIRDAVVSIRKTKLPDPKVLANSGSFFMNPIVDKWQADNLQTIDPNIPLFDMGEGQFKIPSGWLIENTGLKDQIFHGMRVYDKNALVLVNESAKTYADLAAARYEIAVKVYDKFHVQLEQEPLEIK